ARLRSDVESLTALGLIKLDGDTVRATRAVVPIATGGSSGGSLAICDRLDTPTTTTDAVLWPDDSSLHLIGALPAGRVGRWIDAGTGSALAPLAAPGRASHVRATDVSARAIAAAALGTGLSGLSLELAVADLLTDAGAGWD